MKSHFFIFINLIVLAMLPILVLGGEVYKWTDEKGTINLTDDPKRIPEKFKDQVETISVPDKYEEPLRPVERVVVLPPPPEKPKVIPVTPTSGFIPFDKFKYLTEGMSEVEVLSRLGPPTREVLDELEVRGRRIPRWGVIKREVQIKRYYYIGDCELGERTTIIHLKNGIVQKIERIFPPTW